MARPANTPTAPTTVELKNEEQREAAIYATQAAALSAQQTDAVFESGMDIGRLEALDFIRTVSTSALLSVFENVRKSKGWKYLRNPENTDGQHFQSLDEFCRVKLGKSYDRLREIGTNRNLIGEQAFEQAEKIGLRQVDYNAIRALPAPRQAIIKEALAEGADKDTVTRALRELAAQSQRDIDQLSARAEKAEQELAENEQLLAGKNQRIDELKIQTERIRRADPEEIQQALLDEATQRGHAALAYVRGELRLAFQALQDHERAGGETHRHFMHGIVKELRLQLDILQADFFLEDQQF